MVFNLYIWLIKSPTDAKPRDVGRKFLTIIFQKIKTTIKTTIMKTKNYLLALFTLFMSNTYSQLINKDENEPVLISKMPNDKPVGWKSTVVEKTFEEEINQPKIQYVFANPVISAIVDPPPPIQTVVRGRNFMANNFNNLPPADNNLAISNSGKIVSVDNYSIQIFNETVVLSGNTLWPNFFTDTSLIGKLFDPRVIYDRYNDRFILIMLFYNTTFTDSRLLIAFSNPATSIPSTWNFYQITLPTTTGSAFIPTTTTKYWYDYPNIGINKNELFISTNVIKRVSGVNQEHRTVLYQLNKIDGYNNSANIAGKNYFDFKDNEGNPANSLVPLSDGLQDDSYENIMYFVNNKNIAPYKTFWYKLTGNYSSSSVLNYTLTPTISYAPAPYANQLGSIIGDRIKVPSSKIRSGFHKNGKLHFVFERGDQGWSEIAYGKINTLQSPLATSLTPNTYGGFEFQLNHMFPSIACMSADGERSIINYLYTGPSIFNRIGAIDNQSNNWGSAIIIKRGLGLLNLVNYNFSATDPTTTYERIGDYTSIQRKYNSDKAWLVGSYPFGITPNLNGIANGVNAWISEVFLDPLTLSSNLTKYVLYPNPNTNKLVNIVLESEIMDDNCELSIKDFTGNEIFKKQLFSIENTNIEIPNLEKGIYFVAINSKSKIYENKKLVIN